MPRHTKRPAPWPRSLCIFSTAQRWGSPQEKQQLFLVMQGPGSISFLSERPLWDPTWLFFFFFFMILGNSSYYPRDKDGIGSISRSSTRTVTLQLSGNSALEIMICRQIAWLVGAEHKVRNSYNHPKWEYCFPETSPSYLTSGFQPAVFDTGRYYCRRDTKHDKVHICAVL